MYRRWANIYVRGQMTVTDRLHSYPKVWNLGHPAIKDLFEGGVVVQEKIDGSQFSFGVIGGELHCRSKGAVVHVENAPNLFAPAVATAKRLHEAGLLVEGWQYRGEAMFRPKHNTLAYERAPEGGLILFDIDTGLENRVDDPEKLAAIAEELGLECVPTFFHGVIQNVEELKGLLDNTSVLGGAKVEGVVIKNYSRYGEDGKMLMGKVVSEDFREKHKHEWKLTNPTRTDIVESIISRYCIERRWEKGVERMRDGGRLESSPRDIGPLMKEVPLDVKEECEDEIKAALFSFFWPTISRGIVRGLPDWYKQRLIEQQFATDEAAAA